MDRGRDAMGAVTLLETARVRGGVAPLWRFHLRRLAESCASLGLRFPTIVAPSGGEDRVHRLEVSDAGVWASERPLGSTEPVRIVTASARHHPYPWKTTGRQAFEEARGEAVAAGADDALLLTEDGLVAECGIWSLLWWEGDRLCAPDFALGVLRGVGRARLAELVGVTPRRAMREELEGRSLVVVNAARGVVPVAELDGRAVPESPATARLAERFWP
jgi:branched-subunit amino acid aminotransferase/4-amino-4-deoxychorismate lyase